MHRFLRGVERSCLLRAGRREPLSSISAASASRWQGLASQQAENGRRCHSTALSSRSRGVHASSRDDFTATARKFSSLSAHTVASQADGLQDLSAIVNDESRPPSALDRANLSEITPGLALSVLQIYAAQPACYIRHSDFVKLCESARPGKMRDGRVIATALREFKKNNRFNIHIVGASAAVEGMLRAMTPTWKVQDGRPRLRAATFVAQQILDEGTGLYFAVETVVVNKVLEEMQKGLVEMAENGFNVRVDIPEKKEEEEEEEGESEEGEEAAVNADDELLMDALEATEGIVNFFTKRRSRPEQHMKKRAARVYLKKLRTDGGMNTTTQQLAADIAARIGGEAVAKEKVCAPHWWKEDRKDQLRQIIEDAAAALPPVIEEAMAAASDVDAEEEPPADEEADAENTDTEEVESASDDGDAADAEEVDSQTDNGQEEGKKD